jgi:hypothetical protein
LKAYTAISPSPFGCSFIGGNTITAVRPAVAWHLLAYIFMAACPSLVVRHAFDVRMLGEMELSPLTVMVV